MSERCPCIVPYCRRTTGRVSPAHEWICSDHWKPVSRHTKRRRALAKRLLKRATARATKLEAQQGGLTDAQIKQWEAVADLEESTWTCCKAEAIEKAAGI